MNSNSRFPVVAVFASRGQAEAAIDELWHLGYPKEQIGLATRDEPLHQAHTRTEGLEENAAEGAVVGALTGTGLGALAGAVLSASLPGVGPVLLGGLLWGVLGGAAAGAALGTFAGPFIALGFSNTDVKRFETELRTGRTIVVVNNDDRRDEALAILRSHDPVYTNMTEKSVSATV